MNWVENEKRAAQERQLMRLNRQGYHSEGDYLWSQTAGLPSITAELYELSVETQAEIEHLRERQRRVAEAIRNVPRGTEGEE